MKKFLVFGFLISVSISNITWGSHSKAFKNLANYDEVLVYGDVSNSQKLYFKGGILKLIK